MKKRNLDGFEGFLNLFEEFGESFEDGQPENEAESYDSSCLEREELVTNLCRKVWKREKLMIEPLMKVILTAMKRSRKNGALPCSYAEVRAVRCAVSGYIREKANVYLTELKKIESGEPAELTGEGREAYDELLILLKGLYDEKIALRPDRSTNHYRSDPYTSKSYPVPIVLRDFDFERKGDEGDRLVFYPELKPRRRGSHWTNDYTMYDGYSTSLCIITGLILRTVRNNERIVNTVTAAVEESFIEKMGRRQPARICFNDRISVDKEVVVGFLRSHGLDFVDAADYPENTVQYRNRTEIPDTYLRLLFNGEYTDMVHALFNYYQDEIILDKVLGIFYEEYVSDELYRKYEKTTESTYAEVYQTKKNIPEIVKRAMRESPFLDYFGYVEYDQMVDREAIKEVYKDFEAVVRTFFNGMRAKDYEIRFRFLGRHRAAGLYYYTLGCLCVDLRYPSSLSHEFFHLYDYDKGNLSDSYEFRPVRRRYEYLVQKWNRENKTEAQRIKGKYDLDYYLTPTEIFARCGEMYLVRVQGVRNSVVKEELSGFMYPDDEELMKLIREYFGKELAKGRLLPAVYRNEYEFGKAA